MTTILQRIIKIVLLIPSLGSPASRIVKHDLDCEIEDTIHKRVYVAHVTGIKMDDSEGDKRSQVDLLVKRSHRFSKKIL